MIDRFKSRPTLAALAAAAITALGVGGVAVAQSGTPTDQATQAQNGAAEQGAPEKGEANEKADANEKGEANDKAEGPEKADDDGAGGHADQPGDDAGREVEGQE